MNVIWRIVAVGIVVSSTGSARAAELVPKPAAPWTSDMLPEESKLGNAIAAVGGVAVAGAPTNYEEGTVWRLAVEDETWTSQQAAPLGPLGDNALLGTSVVIDAEGTIAAGAPGLGGHVLVFAGETVSELEVGSGVKNQLGTSLALAGEVLLVGDQASSSCELGPCGAVFLFQWVEGLPQIGSPIVAPVPFAGQQFGRSVAATGGPPFRAVIGAPGDYVDEVLTGAIYLMQENDMKEWGLTRLVPDIAPGLAIGDKFGTQVAISDAWVLATTFDSGHVYAYDLAGKAWQLLDALTPSIESHRSVVINGQFAAVGDYDDDGAVTLLSVTGDGFAVIDTVFAPESGLFGRFGRSLALDGDALWVGEPDVGAGRVHRYVLRALLGEACAVDGDCAVGLCLREVCAEPEAETTSGNTTGSGTDGSGDEPTGEGGEPVGEEGGGDGVSSLTTDGGSEEGTGVSSGDGSTSSGEGGGVGFDYDDFLGCACSSRGAPTEWALGLLGLLGLLRRRRARCATAGRRPRGRAA